MFLSFPAHRQRLVGLLLLLHLQFAFAQQLLHCENTLEKINSCQGKFKIFLYLFSNICLV